MSVKSPDNDTTNTEFSSLLSRHPELAEWLTAHSQQEPALSTEEVYRLFLEECTNCGISNEEYPFALEDNGKSALLAITGNCRTGPWNCQRMYPYWMLPRLPRKRKWIQETPYRLL